LSLFRCDDCPEEEINGFSTASLAHQNRRLFFTIRSSFVKLPASEFKKIVPANSDLLQAFLFQVRGWDF
jgi:hypothetical protein